MSYLPSQIYNPANGIPNFNLGSVPNMGNLYSSVMTELQGYGNAQAAALKQNYENALGMGKQQLAQSGLAGTSIAPSIGEGYMKQYQLALNNLSQQLTSTQVGYQTQIGQAANQMGLQQNMANQSLGLGYAQLAERAREFALGQQGGGGVGPAGSPASFDQAMGYRAAGGGGTGGYINPGAPSPGYQPPVDSATVGGGGGGWYGGSVDPGSDDSSGGNFGGDDDDSGGDSSGGDF
jgi:hypothetical protein